MRIVTDSEDLRISIPKDNKQEVYCCSLRFAGCGYIDYRCNIPVDCFQVTRIFGKEVLCPMCRLLNDYSDMVRLTYINFQNHIHPENITYVKLLLDSSGIKDHWIFRP